MMHSAIDVIAYCGRTVAAISRKICALTAFHCNTVASTASTGNSTMAATSRSGKVARRMQRGMG